MIRGLVKARNAAARGRLFTWEGAVTAARIRRPTVNWPPSSQWLVRRRRSYARSHDLAERDKRRPTLHAAIP